MGLKAREMTLLKDVQLPRLASFLVVCVWVAITVDFLATWLYF